ncbi:hypothetical protein [Bradyrhizobium japonicum]|uniref:hypothetical protein n=1 Tax=Bradyrhizobium japonicum TaxID=375 RepID=UPI0035C8ECF8
MRMMVVTHEVGFTREVADTVWFLDKGRIIESGTPPEVLDNSSHEWLRSFPSGRVRALPAPSCS